jgi:hypothetical protein
MAGGSLRACVRRLRRWCATCVGNGVLGLEIWGGELLANAVGFAYIPKGTQEFSAAIALNRVKVELEWGSVLIYEGTQGICCLVLGGQEIELDVP